MIFRVSPTFYPWLMLFIVLGYPLLYLDSLSGWRLLLIEGANIAIFIAVSWANSSNYLSLWEGLTIISVSMQTGCANITIIYLIPLLIVIYLIAIGFTVIGLILFKKEWTEQAWECLIDRFCNGLY